MRLFQRLKRFGRSVQLEVSISQGVMSRSPVGPEIHRLQVLADGFVIEAFIEIGFAQIKASLSIVWLQGQGLLIGIDRFVVVAGVKGGITLRIVRFSGLNARGRRTQRLGRITRGC